MEGKLDSRRKIQKVANQIYLMAVVIHRENWTIDKITSKSRPNWNCPSCVRGHLSFEDNWFVRVPNSSTRRKANRMYYYNFPEEEMFHFTGFLTCNNSKCREKVAVIGKSGNQVRFGNGQRLIRKFFIPFNFFPTLNIFPLSDQCPENISKQIKKSFSHFFNDQSAAANSLRIALEYLLNDLNIDKSTVNKKGKKVELSLHSRIQIFGKQNPELQPFLIAAKWIGNAGSHVGEIDKNGLLDGYELLYHCIDELYEKSERMKNLSAKAKEINDTRKPIKKQ